MARNQITFETLDAILQGADMYFAQPDEDSDYDDDSDAVSVRPATRGKGYRPEGFALVMRSEVCLYTILAAAGAVATEQEHDDADDALPWLDFARSPQVDSLGRSSIIVYWPDWEITGLPEHMTV